MCWPPCCSPRMLPPLNICSCNSLWLESFSPKYLPGWCPQTSPWEVFPNHFIYSVNFHPHPYFPALLFPKHLSPSNKLCVLLIYFIYYLSLLKHKLPVGRDVGLFYFLLNSWHQELVFNKYLLNKWKNCKIYLSIKLGRENFRKEVIS